MFFLGALILGAGLLTCGLRLALFGSTANARRLMFATLVYLPALFALMSVDKIRF